MAPPSHPTRATRRKAAHRKATHRKATRRKATHQSLPNNVAALNAAADSVHQTVVKTGTVDPPRTTATPSKKLQSSEPKVVVPESGMTNPEALPPLIKAAAEDLAKVRRGVIDCGGNGDCGARC